MSVDTGRQHKTMTEMQKVNLFHFLASGRILEQDKEVLRDTQAGTEAPSGLAHPNGWRDSCLCPFIKDSGTCSLPPCCDLPCIFLGSLRFGLLFPKTGDSSMSMRVPPNLSKHQCCLYTEILLFKIDKLKTVVGIKYGISYTIFFRALAFPAARLLEIIYHPPHHSSAFNPFFPTTSNS